MGPTWGPSGADRTQEGPMLAPWPFAIWDLIDVFVTNVVYLVNRTVSFTQYAFQPNTSLRNKIRKRWTGDVGYMEYWKRIVSSWLGNLLVPFKHRHSFIKHKNKHQTTCHTVINQYQMSFVYSTMIHINILWRFDSTFFVTSDKFAKNLIKYQHKPLISSKIAVCTISYLLQIIRNLKPTRTLKRDKYGDYACIDVAHSIVRKSR